jgi:hypothetical protein
MYGVFRHNDEWVSKYNYWHVARPFVGAVLGTVGFLIFFGLIQATTQGQGTTTTTSTPQHLAGVTSEGLIIYYVLAFIVGYREETFRDLVKRATDILFRPGGVPAEGAIDVFPGAPIPYGRVPVDGTSEPIDVRVTNQSDTTIVVPAGGVSFTAGQAKHWSIEDAPAGDQRLWYSAGAGTTIPPSHSMWIRTLWKPIDGESTPGTTEYAYLSIAYSGVVGPPKSILVNGAVPPAEKDSESEDNESENDEKD